MPTPQQFETVEVEIGRLKQARFMGEHLAEIANDNPGSKGWGDLTEIQKSDVMARLEFEGFTPEQSLDVIANVAEGKGMIGSYMLPGEAAPALEAAKDASLMPGWREELESMFRDIAFAPDFDRQMREGTERERGMDR